MVRRIYKGIPESCRAEVWLRLLSLSRVKHEQAGVYEVSMDNCQTPHRVVTQYHEIGLSCSTCCKIYSSSQNLNCING